ncbi:hypothetical protein AB0G74_12850 [Streptomyces sp. NPDC020875]|uniref:hypothetical protein n=1 Tax=Streptomyces sp. NPDC020875 TaxID=3154898 RepID=UPI00340DCD8B
MTRDALLTHTPHTLDAICVQCGRPTCAPVEVGVIDRANGTAVVLYACPRCVLRHSPGPTPAEDVSR